MDWGLFLGVSGVVASLLAVLIAFAIDTYFTRKELFVDRLAKGMRRKDG